MKKLSSIVTMLCYAGTSETSVEKRQDPEGASNAGPVPATNGHAPTTNGILSDHRSRSTSKERSAPPVTGQ